jgi:hypothetical protein
MVDEQKINKTKYLRKACLIGQAFFSKKNKKSNSDTTRRNFKIFRNPRKSQRLS